MTFVLSYHEVDYSANFTMWRYHTSPFPTTIRHYKTKIYDKSYLPQLQSLIFSLKYSFLLLFIAENNNYLPRNCLEIQIFVQEMNLVTFRFAPESGAVIDF